MDNLQEAVKRFIDAQPKSDKPFAELVGYVLLDFHRIADALCIISSPPVKVDIMGGE